MNGWPSEDQELEFYVVQACRYEMGMYFSGLWAKPESFSDFSLRWYLPAVYTLIKAAKDWLDWDAFLSAFAKIEREGWKREHRKIMGIPTKDIIESDLDHIILWACLVAHVYDPNKRWWAREENQVLRSKAILMFLLHEADELIIGDRRPDEPEYAALKENSIPLARRLLVEKYSAHPKLLALWDEFNMGETELARDIAFLDHEIAVHKAMLYDLMLPLSDRSELVHEFGEYYQHQHADHPDVGQLERYHRFHWLRSILDTHRTSGMDLVNHLRGAWNMTKQGGDFYNQAVPWATAVLSQRIFRQFSAILPE